MKIKELDGTIIDVFAVYWFGDETYFYGLERGEEMLHAYRKEEVSIIEAEMNFKTVHFNNGIFHWALIKEELLDDLIERDEDAYNRFLEIIKSEGLVDPDFY